MLNLPFVDLRFIPAGSQPEPTVISRRSLCSLRFLRLAHEACPRRIDIVKHLLLNNAAIAIRFRFAQTVSATKTQIEKALLPYISCPLS